MTPFSDEFRMYRDRSHLRQKEVAYVLGVSVSYVSSWETGLKPPPGRTVLARLSELFTLTLMEKEGFFHAAEISRPLLRVPRNTPSVGYQLAHRLIEKLPELCPKQLALISGILDLSPGGKT
jgi:transcriptional regulator with XRE-family HTH domain